MDKKKLSNKHEADIADIFGGRTQIASGAIPLVGMKGDVISSDYLIECKATLKPYYFLKRKVVEKIEKEALKCGRVPILAIRVLNTDYILYRVFDFIDTLPEITLTVCKESLKLSEETLKQGVLVKIGQVFWILTSIEDFSENYLEGDTV